MKKLLILIPLTLMTANSYASCQPTVRNENLVIDDALVSEFEVAVRDNYAEKDLDLISLVDQKLDIKAQMDYMTKTSRTKLFTGHGLQKVINAFTEEMDMVHCESREAIEYGFMIYNEHIKVFTATSKNLKTNETCTQTVSINNRANLAQVELFKEIIGMENTFQEDDPADTFFRYYSKPVCVSTIE